MRRFSAAGNSQGKVSLDPRGSENMCERTTMVQKTPEMPSTEGTFVVFFLCVEHLEGKVSQDFILLMPDPTLGTQL